MTFLQKHLRNTFLAGVFAAIPLGATIFVVWYVEHITREPLRQMLNINVPFLGIIVAVGLIYALGVAVSSLLGRLTLRLIDALLLRVPGLRELYRAWKQVLVTPGGKEGMYAKVVLVTVDGGGRTLGFSSGDPIPGDPASWCVFVPNCPNPMTGRLYFVARQHLQVLDMSAEEAFKYLVSSGNYVPPAIGASLLLSSATSGGIAARQLHATATWPPSPFRRRVFRFPLRRTRAPTSSKPSRTTSFA
jgi:uncharacterized membrane protein